MRCSEPGGGASRLPSLRPVRRVAELRSFRPTFARHEKLGIILDFSVRGFSPKRMAYLFTFLSVLLLPFHAVADYRGDEYLTAVSFAFMIIAFVLGLRVSKVDKNRFLPFALALIVCVFFISFRANYERDMVLTNRCRQTRDGPFQFRFAVHAGWSRRA